MTLDIVPAGPVDLEMMYDLGELGGQLEAAELPAQRATATVPGAKDSGLTVAISLAGLAVSAMSSVLSVLTYWSSQRPRYSLTIQAGPKTLQVSGLDRAGIQALLRDLKEEPDGSGFVIRVRPK